MRVIVGGGVVGVSTACSVLELRSTIIKTNQPGTPTTTEQSILPLNKSIHPLHLFPGPPIHPQISPTATLPYFTLFILEASHRTQFQNRSFTEEKSSHTRGDS